MLSGMQRTKPYILKLFFSNRYSYAQILRSTDGNILAAASTIEKDLREVLPSTSDKEVRALALVTMQTWKPTAHACQLLMSAEVR